MALDRGRRRIYIFFYQVGLGEIGMEWAFRYYNFAVILDTILPTIPTILWALGSTYPMLPPLAP